MMSMYYVKADLPGLPKGRVERFAHANAGRHVADGAIEPYDEKNKRHADALAAQQRAAEKHQQAEQAKLDAEFAARKTA
jgi:hypothetical protein